MCKQGLNGPFSEIEYLYPAIEKMAMKFDVFLVAEKFSKFSGLLSTRSGSVTTKKMMRPFLFQVRTPFNVVLMNMVLSEFVIASVGVPIDFTASIMGGWKASKSVCIFTGFTLTLTGEA